MSVIGWWMPQHDPHSADGSPRKSTTIPLAFTVVQAVSRYNHNTLQIKQHHQLPVAMQTRSMAQRTRGLGAGAKAGLSLLLGGEIQLLLRWPW
jgi:hypothetical protein